MYVAKSYVRINKKMFAPGECIPDGLPKEKAGWLLSANAVCWYPDAGEEPDGDPDTGSDTETEEAAEGSADGADSPAEPADSPTEPAHGEEPGDSLEDAEAPEIDIMAGFVDDAEPEEAAPRRKPGRRKHEG